MSDQQSRIVTEAETDCEKGVDMKLEVIVIPVSDVDRAKQFYASLGWRLDVDIAQSARFRVVHFTPPGSQCSVLFGRGLTTAKPGSCEGLHLIVSDVEVARALLRDRGVSVSSTFHDAEGLFHHAGEEARVDGPDPERRSYCSFAAFNDPDGNEWMLQEVTTRLPGRVGASTSFSSAGQVASALRRAAAAHGEYERRTGTHDEHWPEWYAEFIVHEQTG